MEGGVCPGESALGDVSQHALRQTHPPPFTELPFRNYVADGKNPNNVHIEQRQRPTKRIRFRSVYYGPVGYTHTECQRQREHQVQAMLLYGDSLKSPPPHPQFPSVTMYCNAADARCGLTINAQVVLHIVWTFMFSVTSPMVGPDFKAISPLNETITWICETFRGERPVKGFKRLNTYTLRNHGDKRAINAPSPSTEIKCQQIHCRKSTHFWPMSFSRSLDNTTMPILPTFLWLCHSTFKRPIEFVTSKCNGFY